MAPSTPAYEHDSYDGSLDDPDVIRGELDTGAKVTCTDLLYILHNYVAYMLDNPSPIRLTAAIASSGVAPLGFGYIHLSSPNRQGFIAVKYFTIVILLQPLSMKMMF